MSDLATAQSSSVRMPLSGLPQRLVQDGIVNELAAMTAVGQAREKRSSFVTQLIASGAAKARDIAVAASAEFGVPVLDLDAWVADSEVARLVSDKILARHRVLPLYRRGKRLYVGVNEKLYKAAGRSVLAHLIKLVDDGKVTFEGTQPGVTTPYRPV